MKCIKIFMILMLMAYGISTAVANVYTWVDENGVRHYSDSPPENAKDAQVVFPEYQYDEAADKSRTAADKKQVNALIQEIEAENAREQAEQTARANQAKLNRKPTQQELIAAEKERLEKKIAFLEQQPLEYFGSQRNKIVRLGYYHYQIQELMEDPDKYFKQPTTFEGNVKYPADGMSGNESGAAGY